MAGLTDIALDQDGAPVSTGVAGLDDLLAGGYPSNRVHLVEGKPGSGKTTLGPQFLLEGLSKGEHGLYITLRRASASSARLLRRMAGPSTAYRSSSSCRPSSASTRSSS